MHKLVLLHKRMRLLLWLEPLWLANLFLVILFPGRLWPEGKLFIAVLALPVFWPIAFLVERRILPPSPLNLALAVMLLWLPVNIWVAVDRSVAWQAAGYLLLGVACYAGAVRWPPFQRHPMLFAWVLLSFGGLLALVGPLIVVDHGTWTWLAPMQQRAATITAQLGETINPNILAGAVVAVLPLAAALLIAPPGPRSQRQALLRRLVLAALTLLLFAVVFFTRSRGAQFAAIVSLSVVVCLRWPRLWWTVVALAPAAIGAFLWIGPDVVLEQIGAGGAIGGLDERLEIWSRAIYALQDFPFTGVGIGHFNRVIPLLYPYFLIPPSVDIPHAHNTVLQVGVDLGFPGLIGWLAIQMTVTTLLIVTWRRQTGLSRALAGGVLGSLVAVLVHGQLDATLWGTRLAFLPWMLYALAVLTASSDDSFGEIQPASLPPA
ncbi:MAG: O-antigen ligase family protein [Caldilinea sp.]|nr:O-antigen ligase family protein [Caldilinea sp.]MDW8440882.1 O-antigen ligase family protein [Caldilineaceae bacterium]